MPRAKQTPVSRPCADCGKPFTTTRPSARFCPPPAGSRSSPCQVAFGNRLAARGKVLAPYVLGWIAGRGGGHAGSHPVAGKCLSEITSIARTFLDEDRAAGRPSAIDYVESIFAEGFLYCDRKRRSRAS